MYIQLLKHVLLCLLIVSYSTKSKVQEYVFINIWDEYNQTTILPVKQGERIFLQPDINIDQASLKQFADSYPKFKNITIDTHNQLMFKYQVRQTPTRVIVQEGSVKSIEPLLQKPKTITNTVISKPLSTLSGKRLDLNNIRQDYAVLFFSDSLCPFQHIPHCQQRIAQNNQLAEQIPDKILTIIKPFYADETSARNYQQRFQVNHQMTFDHQNQLFRYFEVSELPYWIVQNSQGAVIYRGNTPPKKHHLSL
ncbi:TlpA family protein disulfide reductase [Pseudoalteromonas luteoviolacea]|uniref:Uncharacterized protein n=1 Tax=Pseudoalteromonas luteoviolacea S4060-1 TaxID=1365257 RepID=A0A167J2E0_9GAMM|nr:redoxin domain-containing protein [Pseudoalteromonas luteoviolacea]KZN60426.1 hypothetical protein N478_07655 [Pseudoalteromonas luteoviolacea S4060-1]